MIDKLAIGSVQFGMDYGISNDEGEVDHLIISDILKAANEAGISLIDTAKAYGTSETKLGEAGVSNFNIVSKILQAENVSSQISDSLEKLKIERLYGVLVHDFEVYRKHPEILPSLKNEQAIGNIEKVGFSLNKLDELSYLIDQNVKFDILQIPVNLLDQRFIPFLEGLEKKGVEIHARSAFLQGLFFMDELKVPQSLNELKQNLGEIRTLSEQIGVPLFALALNFVLLNPYISKVVIGVTTETQLQENLDALKYSSKVKQALGKLTDLRIDDESLVLPMNWKL